MYDYFDFLEDQRHGIISESSAQGTLVYSCFGLDCTSPILFPYAVAHNFVPTVVVPQLRRLVAGFPPWRPGFDHRSGHVGFVVDKVALRQVFSEYFGFSCQFLFHRPLHTHYLSSGAGTIGQLVDSLSV
jgi:hypothetical protein